MSVLKQAFRCTSRNIWLLGFSLHYILREKANLKKIRIFLFRKLGGNYDVLYFILTSNMSELKHISQLFIWENSLVISVQIEKGQISDYVIKTFSKSSKQNPKNETDNRYWLQLVFSVATVTNLCIGSIHWVKNSTSFV